MVRPYNKKMMKRTEITWFLVLKLCCYWFCVYLKTSQELKVVVEEELQRQRSSSSSARVPAAYSYVTFTHDMRAIINFLLDLDWQFKKASFQFNGY